MSKEMLEAFRVLEEEKHINKEDIIDAVVESLKSAYKRRYGQSESAVEEYNEKTGDLQVYTVREVVDEVLDHCAVYLGNYGHDYYCYRGFHCYGYLDHFHFGCDDHYSDVYLDRFLVDFGYDYGCHGLRRFDDALLLPWHVLHVLP